VYPPAVADRYPDRVAYIMAGSGQTLTYSQLDRASNRLAHLFRQHGIGTGDTVALVLENRIEWPVVIAASLRAGLYVTPLNWHLKPAELAQLLAGARPRALITSAAAIPTHRVAFTSGAPCPPQVKLDIMAWWGPILPEYYGASEGYGHTYISPGEALTRPGSVGRPLSGARVHVTSPDGNELPAGQAGRVCFAAPAGLAYRNAGHGAAPQLRSMGDLGYVDTDGFVFLVRRETNTIVSGGVNIYPAEIEAVLLTHPDVVDAAVVGEPDPEFGERVVAVVEPRPGTDSRALSEKLVELCREGLAHYKAPRRVLIADRLPRRPNGKLSPESVHALVTSIKETS
jgi:acyl-CoA synthetase (AMP-forming)/AMP-acid ligase II